MVDIVNIRDQSNKPQSGGKSTFCVESGERLDGCQCYLTKG